MQIPKSPFRYFVHLTLMQGMLFNPAIAANSMPPSQSIPSKVAWYQPSTQVTWHWQLQGDVNPNRDAELFDIDLFDTSTQKIQQLHDQGKKVICYFSAGSHEDWRDDAKQFPTAAVGKALDGWKGERWLDIRSPAVQTLMQARLALAKTKQCDGVEPDNVDGYSNHTGFSLNKADQIAYNRWLAQAAHSLNLSIALKNASDITADLVDYFDFSVVEQCHEYNECDKYTIFVQQGKPVLNAEYHQRYITNHNAKERLCDHAKQLGLNTQILPLALDGSFAYRCQP